MSSGRSGGSGGGRHLADQKSAYARQATILRKNLQEWDRMLRTPRGEDWPTMLGRLNAAFNQTQNMDSSIDDVLEHFVYVPRKCTANAQDIPFFLSTRLEMISNEPTTVKATSTGDGVVDEGGEGRSPPKKKRKTGPAAADASIQELEKFENCAAQLAAEYEESMVRF